MQSGEHQKFSLLLRILLLPNSWYFSLLGSAYDLLPENSARKNWSSLVIDPPRKTEPQEVGSFGL